MTYKQFKNMVESLFNRYERRILKGGLEPHEQEFMTKIYNEIEEFNKGYLPNANTTESSQEILESRESKIMDMLDDIGVGYFVMMNSKSPMETIGLLKMAEDSIFKIELVAEDYFIYDGERYDIVYDDTLNSAGTYVDDLIIINKNRACADDNGLLTTIIHELVHFSINKCHIGYKFRTHEIKQFEELICETIASNNDKYQFIERSKYGLYL